VTARADRSWIVHTAPVHFRGVSQPRWGTPGARWDAMMELRHRIEKSREQRGKKNQD
jgi:hypothetical protein